MLNGGTIPVVGFNSITFTVTAPEGYQVASVKSKVDSDEAVTMTGTDNTYTYTHANSGNAVVITVTFEAVAAAEAIVEKGNALAKCLPGHRCYEQRGCSECYDCPCRREDPG